MDNEKSRNNWPRPLARRLEWAVEMLSPSETGTTRGKLGDVRGAGKPVNQAGDWPWRDGYFAGRAGQLAWLVRWATQGPLHPINGGGLVVLCPKTGQAIGTACGPRAVDSRQPGSKQCVICGHRVYRAVDNRT